MGANKDGPTSSMHCLVPLSAFVLCWDVLCPEKCCLVSLSASGLCWDALCPEKCLLARSQGMGGQWGNIKQVGGKPQLELLQGISGAFRPAILTCLMGVSGAGKTTLLDVLAGRKTSESTAVTCHTCAVLCCAVLCCAVLVLAEGKMSEPLSPLQLCWPSFAVHDALLTTLCQKLSQRSPIHSTYKPCVPVHYVQGSATLATCSNQCEA